jgi:hypothetical protein
LGKKDLGTVEFPEVETAQMDEEIAFRLHKGGHTTGPNWPTFLKVADRYIKAQSANKAPDKLRWRIAGAHSLVNPSLGRIANTAFRYLSVRTSTLTPGTFT